MEPLTDSQIRNAICNCTRGERSRLNLPDLGSLSWEDLDVLGWRDPKAPQRGYLVTSTEEGPVGVMVRAPETRVRRMAQCLLCQSRQLPDPAPVIAERGEQLRSRLRGFIASVQRGS